MNRLAIVLIVAVALWDGGRVLDGGRVFRPGMSHQQQTFRTSTDAVVVDVSVRRGNTPVTGLTAASFELRDNGVKQDVELVETTGVPIDLSVVVDVSGNLDRPWIKPVPMSKVTADVNERVAKLTKLLRPGDRVRLMAQDAYVQQLWPLQAAAIVPVVSTLQFDGNSSLFDTLAVLLMQPVEVTRRHVIVGSTRGADSLSTTRAAAVRQIAERSDAQMHLVMQEVDADSEASVRRFQCPCMSLCFPTHRFWVPRQTRLFRLSPNSCPPAMNPLPPDHTLLPDGVELKAAAEATGGGLYQGEVLSEPSLHGTFARAFENFRQSYVLRYVPKGVARAGWHDITVTVPGDKSLKIIARRGYAVEETPPPAAPVAAPAEPRTLDELLRAYEAEQFGAVAAGLRAARDPARWLREFDEGANPWPGSPMREAAFALELAEGGVFSSQAPAREEALKLLERFAKLVQHPVEPEMGEAVWHYAAITLMQGTLRPELVERFATMAVARFPNEPRFLLAKAIAADQRTAITQRRGGPMVNPATTQNLDAARALLEGAAKFPEVAAEAQVRLGYLLHRQGRHADALDVLEAVAAGPTPDRATQFLHQLFRGHTLMALNRDAEGIRAYRSALGVVPTAQSARVSLMHALFRRGDAALAEAEAERVQAETSNVFDPWWMYWQGQFRLYPQVIARLRELAK